MRTASRDAGPSSKARHQFREAFFVPLAYLEAAGFAQPDGEVVGVGEKVKVHNDRCMQGARLDVPLIYIYIWFDLMASTEKPLTLRRMYIIYITSILFIDYKARSTFLWMVLEGWVLIEGPPPSIMKLE